MNMMDGMKIARERLLYSLVEDEGDRMNIMPEYCYVSACSCMSVVRWNHVKVCEIVFEDLLVGLQSNTTLRIVYGAHVVHNLFLPGS